MSEHPKPFQPFLPFLSPSSNQEDPIPLLASTVLTTIIASSTNLSSKATSALPRLFSYLSTLTKVSDGGLQDIAVLEYSALLRSKAAREVFWEQRKETVGPLTDILRAAAGVGSDSAALWSGVAVPNARSTEGSLGGGVGLQLLYHVLLVLWQLSFEGTAIGEDFDE